MKHGIQILAALALILSGLGRAQGDLITNGSFEENASNFVNNGLGGMSLSPGDPTLTGWTITGSNSLAWLVTPNSYQVAASKGSYFLDLTGLSDQMPYPGVSQTITTVAGDTYLLQFDLGSSTIYNFLGGDQGTSSLTASAGSASETFISPFAMSPSQWQTESLLFTATSTSTAISLVGAGNSGQYIGLDNVSVNLASAAPEPASLTLLGLGAICSLGYSWRRRKLPKA